MITIGRNINSLRALRQAAATDRDLQSTFSHLSSGQRITKAYDDAAALAIADGLRGDSRVLAQGGRNINDGISYLNVVGGATEQLKTIIMRGQELAEQSANGVYSSQQRAALDTEFTALQAEYNRILESTSFNGVHVFDATNSNVALQAGYGDEGLLQVSLGDSTSASVSGTGTFSAQISNASLVGVRGVVPADVNGDGVLDLVASVSTGGTFVSLGNGNGTFLAPTSYSAGAAVSVTVGDLNGDSKEDIAVADGSANTAYVLIGNGNGTFSAKVSYGSVVSAYFIISSDLNGDNKLDLVTADRYGGGPASIFIGNGNGTFYAPLANTSGNNPESVAAADLNGDGKKDLVLANNSSQNVTVLLGNGNGTFLARTTYSGGSEMHSIAIADFDGDSNNDLVSTFNTGVLVYLGNGNGSFKTKISYDSGVNTVGIVVADLNSDGKLDMYTGGVTTQTTVLFGNGNGSFAAKVTLSSGSNPWGVAAADLNQDGVTDLVASNLPTGTLSVFLQSTTSTESSGPSVLSRLGSYSISTEASARTTLDGLSENLDEVNSFAGNVGSWTSRLESVVRTLGSTTDNIRGAESRIRDVDVAVESANMVRYSMRQQASTAILAQVNTTPEIALRLLTG